MKSITTLVLFASIVNLFSFVDTYIQKDNGVKHVYSYDTLATVRYETAKPKSFNGFRAPAIVSNR